MYATATGSFASMYNTRNISNVYKQIGVETGVSEASSHHLVTMLFNGALDSISQARGAMATRQIELKCAAIGKALRIIDEGLKAGLNLNAGGELSQQLNELYHYISTRLTQANLRNDPDLLEECSQLLLPIRDAWLAIAPADAKAVRASMEIRA